MKNEERFAQWLKEVKCYKKSTIQSRISNVRKIEYYYPDLETQFIRDECQSLLNLFTYSQLAFENGNSPKHTIPIDGERPWEGTATYKNSLVLFIEFKNFEAEEIKYKSFQELSSNDNHNEMIADLKKVFASFHYTKAEFKNKVAIMQLKILELLRNQFENFNWVEEYKPSDVYKDRIDIYGESESSKYKIIIELDANRADQVAKKFLSRSVLMEKQSIIYVSLCYLGTPKMNKIECSKYFDYCEKLSKMISNDEYEKLYIGLFLDRKLK